MCVAKRDDSKAIDFEKTSQTAVLYHSENRTICYWCSDESRLGLKTITRRRLTQRGIKPIGPVQWSFKSYYLYGLVEPLTGDHWFLESSHLNTDCFEAYLSEFSQTYPNDLHIIQLDNARFHTAKRLVIPNNIILWFQPPYSPDCNPIERVWAWIKSQLAWRLFDSLEHLQLATASISNLIPRDFLTSISGRKRLAAALDYWGDNILYRG